MASEKKCVCVNDLKEHAFSGLRKDIFEFLEGKAGDGVTITDNEKAIKRYRFLPKYLVDVSMLNLKTTVLGQSIDLPICCSPFSNAALFHPDGEKAIAKATETINTLYVQSMSSNFSIEDVSAYAPTGLRWIQVYMMKTREITLEIIKAAERYDYKAVVVTIDVPVYGRRRNDIRNGFKVGQEMTSGNFQTDRVKRFIDPNKTRDSISFVNTGYDDTVTWEDIRWLKKQTHLKLVLKGILTYADAKRAVQCGVDGIVVSNHGGRQLDGLPASIDCLSDVVRAVDGQCEVYLDSGIRSGSDVLKALALGARTVFIARPVAWALFYNGENGVKDLMNLLRDELRVAMALAGVVSVQDVDKSILIHQSSLGKL